MKKDLKKQLRFMPKQSLEWFKKASIKSQIYSRLELVNGKLLQDSADFILGNPPGILPILIGK